MYADERRLRVFDGTNGTVVFETEIGSATRLEYPIIADVDVDGKAEIVVVANEFNNPTPLAGIFVYGTPSERWVPTRSIWNQHTYHITNINEDGTVPRYGWQWELERAVWGLTAEEMALREVLRDGLGAASGRGRWIWTHDDRRIRTEIERRS